MSQANGPDTSPSLVSTLFRVGERCDDIEAAMRARGCSLFGDFESYVKHRLGSDFEACDYPNWKRWQCIEGLTSGFRRGEEADVGSDSWTPPGLVARKRRFADGARDPLLELLAALLSSNEVMQDFFAHIQRSAETASREADRAFPSLAGMPVPRAADLAPLLRDVATASGATWTQRGRGSLRHQPLFTFEATAGVRLVCTLWFIQKVPMGPLYLDWETFAVPASEPLQGCGDVGKIEGARRIWLRVFRDFHLYSSGHESAASVARSVQALCWLCQELASAISLAEQEARA